MITVTFFKRDEKTVRVTASGHSGLAKHGNDVLCAAASALIQTAYLAIAELSSQVRFERDTESGYFSFTVGEVGSARHDIDVIIRALAVGLGDLQSGYPQNIEIKEKTLCL